MSPLMKEDPKGQGAFFLPSWALGGVRDRPEHAAPTTAVCSVPQPTWGLGTDVSLQGPCALPFSLGKPRHQRLGCESWTDPHPRRPLYFPRLPLQSGFAAPDLRTGPWLTGTSDTPQKPTTDPTAHGAQLPFPKAGSGHLSSAQKPAVAPVAQ